MPNLFENQMENHFQQPVNRIPKPSLGLSSLPVHCHTSIRWIAGQGHNPDLQLLNTVPPADIVPELVVFMAVPVKLADPPADISPEFVSVRSAGLIKSIFSTDEIVSVLLS